MNEEKKSLQSEVESLVKSEYPFKGEHPLNMLHNQVDPDKRPKVILQKPIRTYESDIAEAIASRKTSVLNIAIEEKKKEDNSTSATISNKPSPSTSNWKKFTMLLLSIILIAGGIGGGYYLYLQSPLALPKANIGTIINTKLPSIIKPDNQKSIELGVVRTDDFPKKIQDILFNDKTDIGKINEYILNISTGSTTTRIDGPQFFQLLDTSAPESLNRSLTKKWMIGTSDEDFGKAPFIILSTDFFQNTFAGMLKWESDMPDEMAIAFNYNDRARQDNGTTTINSFFTIRGRFQDRVVSNRDVREFISESGELLILYSFIDKDTLVITTNEETLKKLIQKIEKQSYLR